MSTEPRNPRRALVVVDAQHDFTEGWALPVEGGTAVCERIAALLDAEADRFDAVFSTYDWHPHDAPFHFAADGTDPDFVEMWPRHCVAGTEGAVNPPALAAALDRAGATRVYKGQHAPAYSGFEGHAGEDGSGASLAELLEGAGVDEVVIGGLALDFCVRATALDALRWAGPDRTVTVRLDLTEPVDPDSTERVVAELAAAGARIEDPLRAGGTRSPA